MSVDQRWPLQQSIYAHLAAVLLGEGAGGVDVPVFDHVPADPPRLHVRIDGFSFQPGNRTNAKRAQHNFLVHVFDENTGTDTGAGSAEVARLQSLIVPALEDWSPLSGATAIKHISTNSAADEDPATQHGLSRFSTHI